MVLETIRTPIIGFATSATSLVISIEAATAIAQLCAAILAIAVAIVTIWLTVMKIKVLRKESRNDNT